MLRTFKNREQAGEELGRRLRSYRNRHPVVTALPRGGVPVGFEVAKALDAPLDVIMVRKVGAPGRPELGLGAAGEGGVSYLDEEMLLRLGISKKEIQPAMERAKEQVDAQLRELRGGRLAVDLRNRAVIIVDDGIATGGTMRAAIKVARAHGASQVIVAVPVAGPESLERVAGEADEVVCLEVSPMLWAIGLAYEDFEQVETETVRSLLQAADRHATRPAGGTPAREVSIRTDGVVLTGDLTVPKNPKGLVIFAHGSGSNRYSKRNRKVARHMQEAGIATLLFDILSAEEMRLDGISAQYRYNIQLIAARTIGVVDWCRMQPILGPLPKACFGASTGAAGALAAAAERPAEVAAVVSRGGRPDLAAKWLSKVRAPCLLLVGEKDLPVLEIHAETVDKIAGHTRLAIVHGAGHLFEAPGAIEEVGRRTTEFLRQHLVPRPEARA